MFCGQCSAFEGTKTLPLESYMDNIGQCPQSKVSLPRIGVAGPALSL